MKEIKGIIKNYDWGNEDFIPSVLGIEKDGKPNAEYWLSTSTVLFKIISIAKPLSVQCHPSDEQACLGFSAGNPNYSSPYGKPEAICALSDLKMRCGVKDGVSKALFLEILRTCRDNLDSVLDSYMNVLTLKPGQAVFIKPGTIHQYICGNGIEIMSFSDNVIRGGMTGKRVDLDELAKIADFTPCFPEVLKKTEISDCCFEYSIPCEKFSLKYAEPGHVSFVAEKETIVLFMSGKNKGKSFLSDRGEVVDFVSDGKVFFAC